MHCKERDNHPSEHIDFARYLQKLFHLLIAVKAVQQLLLGHDQRNYIFNLLLCIFLFCRSFSYLSNTPTCRYWDSSANQIISVVAFPHINNFLEIQITRIFPFLHESNWKIINQTIKKFSNLKEQNNT